MFNEILSIILKVAQESFFDVTVFVGIALMLFAYLNYKQDGKIIKTIQKQRKFQPFIGAFLGLTPGCGGAILIAPLYIKKTVSFGTVVATLIATMGDSAFLLITKSPNIFVYISIITFIIGVLSGYLVDYLKIEERFNLNKNLFKRIGRRMGKGKIKFKKNYCKNFALRNNCHFEHIGHNEGDEIGLKLHHKNNRHQIHSIGYKITHKAYWLYSIMLLIGLVIGISHLFNIEIKIEKINNIISGIGITAVLLSIMLMVAGKKFISEHNHEEEEIKLASLKETFIHSMEDTAFIAVWVFVAFSFYEILIYLISEKSGLTINELIMNLTSISKYYAVIIAAMIGMIPGCGPQIIFVSLYLKGILPIEALITQSISQDGDALLPLIAMDIKSSLVLTIITTIIALVVGFLLLAF